MHVGKEDDEYRGWVWCTNQKGKGGWVPINYIELTGGTGVARYDYEATELSANRDEVLTVSQEFSGWAWCTNHKGVSGWLPIANLERLIQVE